MNVAAIRKSVVAELKRAGCSGDKLIGRLHDLGYGPVEIAEMTKEHGLTDQQKAYVKAAVVVAMNAVIEKIAAARTAKAAPAPVSRHRTSKWRYLSSDRKRALAKALSSLK